MTCLNLWVFLESEEGDIEDNNSHRIPSSIASSRSNMSEHSLDAGGPPQHHSSPLTAAAMSASPSSGGGNPRISAPLQNTSLGSGDSSFF